MSGLLARSIAYLDSSAFVKLVVSEPESEALRRELTRWPQLASASLLRTETVRSLRRSGNARSVGSARRLMRSLHLIRLDESLLDRAADLDPPELRSLDAIHLAAALELGPDLGVVIAYDLRLKAAAEAMSLDVVSPV